MESRWEGILRPAKGKVEIRPREGVPAGEPWMQLRGLSLPNQLNIKLCYKGLEVGVLYGMGCSWNAVRWQMLT